MLKNILLLLALNLSQIIKSFGLGIDFGGQYHKASMLLPGKYFTMVEDSISKRKTPSLISFCKLKQFFEYQSLSKFAKKRCDSFYFLNRFFENEDTDYFKEYETVAKFFKDRILPKKNDNGDIFFPIRKINLPILTNFKRENLENENEINLRLEEIYAMLLKNLKQNAERTAEREFNEAVFSIWDNGLSIHARKRLKNSLTLAGFSPLAFVHENTAAAVYHAVNSKFEDENMNDNILIINIGSQGTKLSLINFMNKKVDEEIFPEITVLADFYSTLFSGHSLDYCFSNFALNKNKKSDNADLIGELDNTRLFKLLLNVAKPKQVLSVNKSTRVHIENFFDDMPLSSRVSKEEYEQKCNYVFQKLNIVLQNFQDKLDNMNITSKIDKIELIGGVVRTPKVNKIIQNFYKDLEVGKHINGDDGIAFGTAFMAANYSAGIKTKKIVVKDGPNYSIEYTVKLNDETKLIENQVLYPRKTIYGTRNKLLLPDLKETVQIEFTSLEQNYWVNYNITGAENLAKRFEGKNITSWEGYVETELDLLGFPNIRKGQVLINETITTYHNVSRPINNTNTTDNATETEKTDDENKEEKVEEEKVEEEKTDEDKKEDEQKTDEEKKADKEKKDKKPKVKYETITETRVKHKLHKINLVVRKTGESIKDLKDNVEEYKMSQHLLKDLENLINYNRELGMKKNELESFIFKLKQMVDEEEHNVYLTETEKTEFLEKSKEIDDFMFSDEISSITVTDLKKKIQLVKNLIRPHQVRKNEHLNRQSLFRITNQRFSNYTKAVTELQKSKKWLEENKLNEVRYLINDTLKNITDVYQTQLKTPLFEDPVFKLDFVKNYAQKVEDEILVLEKTKKPTNDTDTEAVEGGEKDDLNLDDLKANMEDLKNMDPKNFDMKNLNMTMEKMKEYMEKIKGMKDKMGEFPIPPQGEKKENDENIETTEGNDNENVEQDEIPEDM